MLNLGELISAVRNTLGSLAISIALYTIYINRPNNDLYKPIIRFILILLLLYTIIISILLHVVVYYIDRPTITNIHNMISLLFTVIFILYILFNL